jgi:hypothetical protein
MEATLDAGYELDRIGTDRLAHGLSIFGLQPNSLPELIAQIPWKILDTPGYF